MSQLKEEQEKNKIPLFTKPVEAPDYLISENTFGSQINPFAKIVVAKEPLTATEARELAERLQMLTSQPIVLDSETLNEPPINNEEFVQRLRDWWGIEASKAIEIAMPETDKKKQVNGFVHKYKVTLYNMKENETIETDLLGADIEEALSTIDRERYGVVGYRRLW